MGNVKSPCNNICQLNENKICIGCYRSIDEIANWTKFTHEQKLIIIGLLRNRACQKQELEP